MEAAPFARDETGRLLALRRLRLVDSPAEERLDRVVQLAARLTGMPMAVMSVVDERRVHMKSVYGAEVTGVEFGEPFRDYWFCAHVVSTGEPVLVADARTDGRFDRIPLVTGEPGLVSYAGVPVRAPGGEVVGALAVFGTEPHVVKDSEVSALEDLARLLEAELGPLAHVTTDALTNAMNFRTFDRLATRFLEFADRVGQPCVLLRADVANVARVNHAQGFDVGDRLLAEAADLVSRSVRGSDLVGRMESDEFAVLLFGADAEAASLVIDRIVQEARAHNEVWGSSLPMGLHLGGAVRMPGEPGDVAGLLLTAEPRKAPEEPASTRA